MFSTDSGVQPEGGVPPTPNPEDDWAKKHEREARLRTRYKQVVGKASEELLEARQQLLDGATFEEQSQAGIRISRLSSVLRDSQAEIDRMETLYRAWRESKRTRHTERLEYVLSIAVLPRHRDDVPDPARLTGVAAEMW